MSYLELISHSPEQTQKLGVYIGQLALSGDVFLLVEAKAVVALKNSTLIVEGTAKQFVVSSPDNKGV